MFAFPPFIHTVASALLTAAFLPNLAHAQAPMPLAIPNLDMRAAGQVNALARHTDGSIVVGGLISSVDDIDRSQLARLLPAGQLDPAFNPLFDGGVSAVVVLADGSMIAGGGFTQVNGLSRLRLVKLSSMGVVDPTWNPGANGSVTALARDASDGIFVGGVFTTISGQARLRIARISATGTGAPDASFGASIPGGTIDELLFDVATNTLTIAGEFDVVNLVSRPNLARVFVNNGSLQTSFNPNANGSVTALQLTPAGLLIGGSFTNIGGAARSRLARLDVSTGAADATFNPTANQPVRAISVDSSARIYVGGDFSVINGTSRARVARLSSTGTLDATWNPGADASVRTLTIEPNGNLLMSGHFSTIAAQTHAGLARLDSSAAPLSVPLVDSNPFVSAVLGAADGSLIAGGRFYRVGSQRRDNLLRMLPNGALDPAFSPATDDAVLTMASDGAGGVYIGGSFMRVNGTARTRLARLSQIGVLNTSFVPIPSGDVRSMVNDGAGSLYVGGSFDAITGQPRGRLARISASTGVADAGFIANIAGSTVENLLLDTANSHIYVGGEFTELDGLAANNLGRVFTSGLVDANWLPNVDSIVSGISFGPASTLVIAGSFVQVNNTTRTRLARIFAAPGGALDPAFNPNINAPLIGATTAADGSSYVCGFFSQINGVNRSRIARILANGQLDLNWNPGVDGFCLTMSVVDNGQNLLLGTNARRIGGLTRRGLALLPATAERVFGSGFE